MSRDRWMRLERPVHGGKGPRHGLNTVRVLVRGDFAGDPALSEDISYEVEVTGNASSEQLRDLVSRVDAIAEIPNSVRRGTPVNLTSVKVTPA